MITQISAEEANVGGQAPLARFPLLTVIIPVFNEAATVGEAIRRVRGAPYSKQVLVVNDGSNDGTAEILSVCEDRPEVEVLTVEANQGKGAAIRRALARAVGRFTIIQDADLEYDPQDYPKLIEPLRLGAATVVYGSRYLCRRKPTYGGRRRFDLGVKALNLRRSSGLWAMPYRRSHLLQGLSDISVTRHVKRQLVWPSRIDSRFWLLLLSCCLNQMLPLIWRHTHEEEGYQSGDQA